MEIQVNPTRTWPRTLSVSCGLGILASIGLALASCGGGGQPRQLIGLAVQPSNAGAFLPSGAVPFSATGTFDQAPTTQTNLTARWTSKDPSVVTIDPGTGLATCVAAGGPITVTASAAGKGGTVDGYGTLECQVRPLNQGGQCEVDPGTNELTGACEGPNPQHPNHCLVTLDNANCRAGQPATSPVWTSGCLPLATFKIDASTACF
jgi:hypothetical protein